MKAGDGRETHTIDVLQFGEVHDNSMSLYQQSFTLSRSVSSPTPSTRRPEQRSTVTLSEMSLTMFNVMFLTRFIGWPSCPASALCENLEPSLAGSLMILTLDAVIREALPRQRS